MTNYIDFPLSLAKHLPPNFFLLLQRLCSIDAHVPDLAQLISLFALAQGWKRWFLRFCF